MDECLRRRRPAWQRGREAAQAPTWRHNRVRRAERAHVTGQALGEPRHLLLNSLDRRKRLGRGGCQRERHQARGAEHSRVVSPPSSTFSSVRFDCTIRRISGEQGQPLTHPRAAWHGLGASRGARTVARPPTSPRLASSRTGHIQCFSFISRDRMSSVHEVLPLHGNALTGHHCSWSMISRALRSSAARPLARAADTFVRSAHLPRSRHNPGLVMEPQAEDAFLSISEEVRAALAGLRGGAQHSRLPHARR